MCESSEIRSVTVYSFEEYRSWITVTYDLEWIDSSEEEIYRFFGKPQCYPFSFYLKGDF